MALRRTSIISAPIFALYPKKQPSGVISKHKLSFKSYLPNGLRICERPKEQPSNCKCKTKRISLNSRHAFDQQKSIHDKNEANRYK